ncbi:MalY/PatB family protein [Spirillospora sp. CA-255316]
MTDGGRLRRNYRWTRYDPDVIPACVADMDLPTADAIRADLLAFYSEGDLTYFDERIFDELRELAAARMAAEFGWHVGADQVAMVNDVVQALHIMVRQLTDPGDRVALPVPVYHHFFEAIREHGRTAVPIPFTDSGERWEWRLDRLADALGEAPTPLLLLCNPHNPTGRCLTRSELTAIAHLALAHDCVVISDEIHADLLHPGAEHTPLASLGPDIAARTITLTSATKAFNIAGTHLGFVIYGSAELRRSLPPLTSRYYGKPGMPGLLATRAAWTKAAPWLAETRALLTANRDHLLTRLRAEAPAVRVHPPEATYLAWLDLSAHTSDAAPHLLAHARIALSDGPSFGAPGGFARLNFATSRPLLDEIITRLTTRSS